MRLLIKNVIPLLLLMAGVLATAPTTAVAEIHAEQITIDNNNLVLVSSRRVTRTVSEYTLRAVASNTSSQTFDNVKASLISVPANFTVVEGNLDFGTLTGTGSETSSDDFTIQINLRVDYSLNDLVWKIEGDIRPPPPTPPDSTPSETGLFLSIDNNVIKGEVDNQSHKDWIQVLAWNSGSSNSGSTHFGGGGGGSANLENINLTKFLDASTPSLLLASASGRYFHEVKIDVIKLCGRNKYTQYALTLNDVIISSVSSGGSGGEDKLTENVSFNMRSLETMYTPVDEKCRLDQPIYSFQSYD